MDLSHGTRNVTSSRYGLLSNTALCTQYGCANSVSVSFNHLGHGVRIPSWQGGQRSDGWPGDQHQPRQLLPYPGVLSNTKAIRGLTTYSLPTEKHSTSFTFNSQELDAAAMLRGSEPISEAHCCAAQARCFGRRYYIWPRSSK